MTPEVMQAPQLDGLGAQNLFVGQISASGYLWSALDKIGQPRKAQHIILSVFSVSVRGRIGILRNRYISGAVIDGTGETGIEAVKILLSLRFGSFGVKPWTEAEGSRLSEGLAIDLKQRLFVDILKLLHARQSLLRVGADPTELVLSSLHADGGPTAYGNPQSTSEAQTQKCGSDPTFGAKLPRDTSVPQTRPSQFTEECRELISELCFTCENPRTFIARRAEDAVDEAAGSARLRNQVMLVGICMLVSMLLFHLGRLEVSASLRDKFMSEGIRMLNANKPAEAMVSLSAAIKKDRGCGRAYFHRALAFARTGRSEEAFLDLDTATGLMKGNSSILAVRASIHAQRHDYDKAINESTEAILADSRNVDAHIVRAISHDQKNEFALATQDYTDALSVCAEPTMRLRLLKSRAFAEAETGNWQAAGNDLNQVIEMSPEESAFLQRGDTYYAQKLLPQAIDDYSHALAYDQQSYEARVARGICEVSLHQIHEAMLDFDEALRSNNVGVEALIQRGLLHLTDGNWHGAVDDFQRAVDLNPGIREAQDKLSVAIDHLHNARPSAPLSAFTKHSSH